MGRLAVTPGRLQTFSYHVQFSHLGMSEASLSLWHVFLSLDFGFSHVYRVLVL